MYIYITCIYMCVCVLKLQPRVVLNAEPSPKLSATAAMGSINCAGRPGSNSPNTVGSAASARGGLHGTGFPGRAAKAAAADAGLGRSWVDAPPLGVGAAGILRLAPAPTQPLPCGPSCGGQRWSGSLRWRRTRSLASNGMRSA